MRKTVTVYVCVNEDGSAVTMTRAPNRDMFPEIVAIRRVVVAVGRFDV